MSLFRSLKKIRGDVVNKVFEKIEFFWLSLLLSSLRIKKNKKNGKLNSLALRRLAPLIKFLKSRRSKKSAQPS